MDTIASVHLLGLKPAGIVYIATCIHVVCFDSGYFMGCGLSAELHTIHLHHADDAVPNSTCCG